MTFEILEDENGENGKIRLACILAATRTGKPNM
jgi:hypothetical protein